MKKQECDLCESPTPDGYKRRVIKVYFGTSARALIGTLGICMKCYARFVNDFIRKPGPKQIAEHMEMRSKGGV
jgi:hypothetical protein